MTDEMQCNVNLVIRWQQTGNWRDAVAAKVAEAFVEADKRNSLWEQKASRLYDLLHECGQWIPRGQQDLYDRVTHELDSGLRYLDETPIGDA